MKKPKILLLSDDLRNPTGVGAQSKIIVEQTLNAFDWVQLAGGYGKGNPEVNKVYDHSKDSLYLKIYTTEGYGNSQILNHIIEIEKPDIILHFTDPRYWKWLYIMENDLRKSIPITYYHVWDNEPAPKYNEPYYNSCDAIYCISKLTEKIVKDVCKRDIDIRYIPHGVHSNQYFPIENVKIADQFEKFDFIVLYNNRNIQRKMTSDVIASFNTFVQRLPEAKRKKCILIMKTNPIDKFGTNLIAVKKAIAPDVEIAFINQKLTIEQLNQLYNISDVTINIASQEGFGLSSLESMMSGTMIINNMTGGLQDQAVGKWAVPVYPKTKSIIGSVETPYLYEDRCSTKDVSNALYKVYNMNKGDRNKNGLLGREYAMKHFSSDQMANKIKDALLDLLETWKPKNNKFNFVKL